MFSKVSIALGVAVVGSVAGLYFAGYRLGGGQSSSCGSCNIKRNQESVKLPAQGCCAGDSDSKYVALMGKKEPNESLAAFAGGISAVSTSAKTPASCCEE